MRDILQSLREWERRECPFALAVVVRTWGSSPRPVGSCMGVREDGLVVGSVSGGCVEGAVIEASLKALESGQPDRLHFGSISNEAAWEVGLSCGGEIDVWIVPDPSRRFPYAWQTATQRIEADEPIALVWADDGSLIAETLDRREESHVVESEAGVSFVQAFPKQERLIIFGAAHIAIPLVGMAKALGFKVVVVDPRAAFLNAERFSDPPDEALPCWPDQAADTLRLGPNDYVVTLSHDPKIDDPALAAALMADAKYVGALGSRSTQKIKREALKGMGLTEEQIARLKGPVGLDIGAKTPEEIAVSIIAELVSVRRG